MPDAREVIAEVLAPMLERNDAREVVTADEILAALSEAGMTICGEQVGYFHRAGMSVEPESWDDELPPAFVPVQP